MNTYDTDKTISASKEESIQKARDMLQSRDNGNDVISRPDISLFKVLLSFFLWTGLCCALAFSSFYITNIFELNIALAYAISIASSVLIILCKAKAMITNTVLLYQKFAPKEIRQSCLFTPSCSEYMLLAVEKYGAFRGFLKGCRRITRCHHPNGGEDYP